MARKEEEEKQEEEEEEKEENHVLSPPAPPNPTPAARIWPSFLGFSDNYQSWAKSRVVSQPANNYQVRTARAELSSFCLTLNFLMRVNHSLRF